MVITSYDFNRLSFCSEIKNLITSQLSSLILCIHSNESIKGITFSC
ncbi:CLUMA_CG002588, isoform A [Clunio marinus]|uniref:CLUMA_CG002588, isoform A n=1 Tax=Clunio marinus TaxID=568069 RepID=A0A1J1HMR2_9DIPT|nr:CLUMA_CG002588, isoform A [Clunio marinus]